ncbi:MAG: hypothetical protein A2049_08940 [Elusimicrobia bacterium GWA2_62_23]|nr:MAG: hypothetical protein A2049_08940 [Elusimicrobia bacterium GWA2_62_23]
MRYNSLLPAFIFLSACASGPQPGGKAEQGPKATPAVLAGSLAVSTPARELRRGKDAVEFEAEGQGISTKYEKPVNAEKRAEEDALDKAVKAAGVYVYSGFQDVAAQYGNTGYSFVGRYLNVWAANLVQYERTAAPACAMDGDIYRCLVKIRGKVYFRGEADPVFELKASLDKPAYYAGDDVNVKVSVSKDSYISVISCDEDGNASLVFPNRYAKDNFLKAGKELNIPRDLPFYLKAFLPKGRAESGEILHVIATKSQPLFAVSALKEEGESGFVKYSLGGLKDLSGRLAKFQRADWTSQVLLYGIRGGNK